MPDSSGSDHDPPATGGRWQPGRSGNPAGRPTGSRNSASLAIDALLADDGEKIARKAVEMALAGDQVAMRLVMERVAPVRRGRPVRFALPPIESAADIVKGLGSLLQSTAAGDISPEEAATIASVLEVKRKAVELVDLEDRLAAIEKRMEASGS